MSYRAMRNLSLMFLVAAFIAVPPAVLAGDEAGHDHSGKQMEKKGEAMMDMPMPTPGPEHALLAKAAGKWKAMTKMVMDPSQPPMIGEGIEEVASVCNGLWISITYKGSDGFEGHGVEGYDTMKKKYVGTWVDSWGTHVSLFEGTADASGKILSYTMMSPNPATGAMEPHTMQHEFVNDATRVSRMWRGPEAKGQPTMEITYTRM